MRKHILFWLFITSFQISQAQTEYNFSGFVTSDLTGISLSNVRVWIPADSIESTTNAFGFFNINTSKDSFTAFIERPGYEQREMHVVLRAEYAGLEIPLRGESGLISKTLKFETDEGGNFNLTLTPIYNTEYTHFIPTSETDHIITDVESDKIVMSKAELESVPFIFSEPDVSKALQINPGVEFASDGFSDMTVRGGGLGQNQILLNGAPVYSLGHLEGYISNFSSATADEVVLYKAAFPARYGGRLSSVMDVKSYSGNAEEAEADLAVSPVLGNFRVGLPLGNGNSLGVTFRRSYIDLLLEIPDQELFYRDFSGKLDLNLNEKNKLTLSYFSLKDKIKLSGSEFNDTNTSVYRTRFYFRHHSEKSDYDCGLVSYLQ